MKFVFNYTRVKNTADPIVAGSLIISLVSIMSLWLFIRIFTKSFLLAEFLIKFRQEP